MLLILCFVVLVGPATAHIDNLRALLHNRHNRRTPASRSETSSGQKIICVNGVSSGGGCACNWGWRGTYCEKKMHCNSYERQKNGSCIDCSPGFEGSECIDIVCKHGLPHALEQKCVCDEPYKGMHCDDLETADVYLLYNQKVAVLGPLGALSIIPMILVYFCCERFAKKRQIRRIEKLWLDQNDVSLDSEKVKYLLEQ